MSSTVNMLSVVLYDLFGADGTELEVPRTGCCKYFERGGECVNGPVSILSALEPSPALLTYHFFSSQYSRSGCCSRIGVACRGGESRGILSHGWRSTRSCSSRLFVSSTPPALYSARSSSSRCSSTLPE
ncbi:squalene epoxidase-domain-containing protein [Mycena galopus ATCC 62051]|nr:squalene epoxidase-domain-containing protein [Mycena galopus ATCC 62051]